MKKLLLLCLFCIFFASGCTMRTLQNHISIPPPDAVRQSTITAALSSFPEITESVVFVDGHTALIGIITTADSRALRSKIAQAILRADDNTFSVSVTTNKTIISKIKQQAAQAVCFVWGKRQKTKDLGASPQRPTRDTVP